MKKQKRNLIFTFPSDIRAEIDRRIGEGCGNWVIHKYLKDNHSKVLKKIPCAETVKSYMDIFKKDAGLVLSTVSDIYGSEESTLTAISNQVTELSILTADSPEVQSNKKMYLERLLATCASRRFSYSNFQTYNMDPKKEKVIQDYISREQSIIETMAKMSGELNEDNTVVVNIVNVELSRMMKAVHDALRKVCPEKAMEFKDEFKRIYSEMKDSGEPNNVN